MVEQSFASTVVELLGVDPGDAAALSIIYDRDENGDRQLRHGSLIFGPPELGGQSWPSWHANNTGRLHHDPGDLGVEFAHEDGPFLIGRAVLSVADAQALLGSLESGQLPSAGPLPAAVVGIEAPLSPIWVFPHQSTEAGQLAAMASRPLHAFLFRSKAESSGVEFPNCWDVCSDHYFAPDRWQLGLVAAGSAGPIAPTGLLVGRLERRAWIREMRGDGDDLHYYVVSIGLDPERITPYELVVEIQEWLGGEFATARRLPLEWLDLSAWSGQDHLELTLPILGAGGRRSVSLYDLGGELLDVSDAVAVVESINLTMTASTPDGSSTATTQSTIGTRLQRTLADRLERLESIDGEYRKLIEDGMAGRVVLSGQQALAHLKDRLEASARSELLVMDRYFGADPHDWNLFDNLTVPVRVLVSKAKHFPPQRAGLEVKTCQHNRRPPFHDRFYLWEDGGLVVGASLESLGQTDSRIDSLEPSEAAFLSARFNQLWASNDFVST